MAALKPLTDIPTVAYLYRTKALTPASSVLTQGNQELNNKVSTIQYDLTKLQVDAIVNAANFRLLGGGGVDGAIHRAAGRELLAECRTLGGCETGSAKITGAYNLPCKKVIHAVGPIYKNDEHSEPLLRGCYRTALQLAVDNDCKSIAFSAISTGIYGYPSKKATKAALQEVFSFLSNEEGNKLERVVFCNFEDKDVNAYAAEIPHVFPPTEEDVAEQVSPSIQKDIAVDKVQEPKTVEGQDGIQSGENARKSSTIPKHYKSIEKSECQTSSPREDGRSGVKDGQERGLAFVKITEVAFIQDEADAVEQAGSHKRYCPFVNCDPTRDTTGANTSISTGHKNTENDLTSDTTSDHIEITGSVSDQESYVTSNGGSGTEDSGEPDKAGGRIRNVGPRPDTDMVLSEMPLPTPHIGLLSEHLTLLGIQQSENEKLDPDSDGDR